MKNIIYIVKMLSGFWEDTKRILLSLIWLLAILIAVYPSILMYPLDRISSGIGSLQSIGISEIGKVFISVSKELSANLFGLYKDWSRLFIENSSFITLPIAVTVDFFLAWCLVTGTEVGRWLPSILICKTQKSIHLNVVRFVVVISSFLLIIAIYRGAQMLGNSQALPEGVVNNTTVPLESPPILIVFFVLLFSLTAKYCILTIVSEENEENPPNSMGPYHSNSN